MQEKKRCFISFVLAIVLMLGVMPVTVLAEEDIKPSTVEYEVNLNDAKCVFIGNEKAIDYEIGRKYFLMYTVSEIEKNTTTQSGMIITTDHQEVYPYTKGGMQYDKQSLLLDEGYSYFFRFEITEEGLECIAGKALKGGGSEYIKLPHVARDIKTPGQFFGAWMAESGSVTGKLTHVRCYDEKGNDLGVYGNDSQGVIVLKKGEMQENESVDHSYSFSLTEANHIAISNGYGTDSDVVYMEYTVKNVKKGNITQSGTIFTNSPTAVFPYSGGSGFMKYMPHKDPNECMLLEDGASYLLRFQKQESGFDILVKRTVNGKVTYFSFPHEYGEFHKENAYFSIWIGEECGVAADFVEVKSYDDKGNNLAIQTNQGVEITHYGDLEDYSQCEAVYYCEANDTFIALDKACTAVRRVDGETVSVTGTYAIREAVLTLNMNGEEESFDYVYKSFSDKNGNKYIRLSSSKVTFVSQRVDGKEIETVDVTAEDGYKLRKPTEPTREGRTFQGWKTAEGNDYDFETVVTESMTLYASWDGEDVYKQTSLLDNNTNMQPIIAIGICFVLLVATVLTVFKISRGKKHE